VRGGEGYGHEGKSLRMMLLAEENLGRPFFPQQKTVKIELKKDKGNGGGKAKAGRTIKFPKGNDESVNLHNLTEKIWG